MLPAAASCHLAQILPAWAASERSVRLAVRDVPWHTFTPVGLGAGDFKAGHSKYQGRRRQAETFSFNCCRVDLSGKALTFAEKCHLPFPIRRCEMKDPTLLAELRNKLGAPSSETVECLRLVKAFLKLQDGQRFEVIELVELLANDPSFELDLPLS